MAIAMPNERDLPPGSLRRLVEALHQLYAEAGRPGTRTLSKAIQANDDLGAMVSHETIAAMLHGKGTPSWPRLEACVRQLAAMSPRRPDPDATALRFHELWCAIPVPTPAPDIPLLPALPSPEAALRAAHNDATENARGLRRDDRRDRDWEDPAWPTSESEPTRQPWHEERIAALIAAGKARKAELQTPMVRAEDLRQALGLVWQRAMQVPAHGQLMTELTAIDGDTPVPATLILEVIRRLTIEDRGTDPAVRIAREPLIGPDGRPWGILHLPRRPPERRP